MSNQPTDLSTPGGFIKLILARLRFVAVFAVAAIVVGYWDDIKNHVDKWTRPAVASSGLKSSTQSDIEYYCPMDLIVRSEPGPCPKCGMPLVPRKKGQSIKLPDDVLARVQLTPQRLALADVKTSAVLPLPLVREIRAVGVFDYDESKLARLSARVAGRVDELFLTYKGQAVRQGEPVYSLYSPEVYTAQREYLLSRQRVNELPRDASPETRADASAVYNAATQKLILWGVAPEQLAQMEERYEKTGEVPTHLIVTSPISGIVVAKEVNAGQYLQMGDNPFTIADLSDLWLQAKLYEEDVPFVNVGQSARVNVEAFGSDQLDGVVAFKSFVLEAQTRTLDARIVVANPGLKIRPGMFASALLQVPVAPPASQPASGAMEADLNARGVAYYAALKPYLQVQGLLATDKTDNVKALLRQTADALKAMGAAAGDAQLAPAPADQIEPLRTAFLDISAAVIAAGKEIHLPADSPKLQQFQCPMKHADWIQPSGPTANPYYGKSMPDCGTAVRDLPRGGEELLEPTTLPAVAAGMVLAVPRSAVIDTGSHHIVYVASAPGTYDMHAVELGPLAGDYYPVLAGLREGQYVVTVGTFLIDSENRLTPPAPTTEGAK